MEMRERELPDTSGLPEFFICGEVQTEVDGPNVRIVIGCRRGGKMHWLYSAVIQAEEALVACERITTTAFRAINRTRVDCSRVAAH